MACAPNRRRIPISSEPRKIPYPFAGIFFLCALLFFFQPAPALAWGCKGHQTVALIAEKHLTPEARWFVDKLLSENPVDPSSGIAAVPLAIC
jgi:hypothetical protein